MEINISDEAKVLLDEMGEKKVQKYIKTYCEFKCKEKKNSDFFFDFSEYLKSSERKEDGYRYISTFSFQQFLFKKYYGFNVFDLD